MYAYDRQLQFRMEEGAYGECLECILNELLAYAIDTELIEDTQIQRDIFDTKLMNCLTPRPETVIRQFQEKYRQSPIEATDYFYRFSQNTDYIRRYRLRKDIRWTVETEYGSMEVLISLSKPEKDPKDIAKIAGKVSSDYPKCALCCENVGFSGDFGHAPRQNHRIIPMKLGGEDFSFQYSPYGYFNEHCIVLNNNHTPMVINGGVFRKLLDFVDLFPHYFIGTNSDLPYVGGSILSHEHFQGGRYELPVMKARVEEPIPVDGYEHTKCEILYWPVSTIKVSGNLKEEILKLSTVILEVWKNYRDEEVGIVPYTGEERHNTLTLLLRKQENTYEMYLMLRNNRISGERPYGVFHTRPELFHIKKEGIGVIDAPGMAILPPRLKKELELVQEALASGRIPDENEGIEQHKKWIEELFEKYREKDVNDWEEIIRNEVGIAFRNMLEDVGVFKMDDAGKRAFQRFGEAVGQAIKNPVDSKKAV
ncbi:MAG: UDP-glucose--hexose-1-phosphate uridylyltransferase [Clostridiales bacterium]|nr:UDP-glucose--hexose-1-phosphate uridylyltransferase [Clostridiales bacterium]